MLASFSVPFESLLYHSSVCENAGRGFALPLLGRSYLFDLFAKVVKIGIGLQRTEHVGVRSFTGLYEDNTLRLLRKRFGITLAHPSLVLASLATVV